MLRGFWSRCRGGYVKVKRSVLVTFRLNRYGWYGFLISAIKLKDAGSLSIVSLSWPI